MFQLSIKFLNRSLVNKFDYSSHGHLQTAEKTKEWTMNRKPLELSPKEATIYIQISHKLKLFTEGINDK